MTEEQAPAGIDVSRPTAARMYDYYLGGKDNFAVDREAAEQVLATAPEARLAARENRAFLQRAVRYLAGEAGVRQFIDLGTGIPTQGNVHEIAQEVHPDARVVYVDNDPVVLVHSRALLSNSSDRVTTIQADLRHPDEILNHPDLVNLIDFGEPVAVLFVAVLHFVTDDEDPSGIVSRFVERMVPGSYLVLSHASSERDVADAVSVYQRATSTMNTRTTAEVRQLFDGCDLLEPGIVTTSQWRPGPGATPPDLSGRAFLLAGVGRKHA